MKRIFLLLLALLLCLPLFSCGEDEPQNPYVKFTMADGSYFIVELYPDIAPVTVENFLRLVEANFYDGLTFHRIYKNFMIQGGDPKGNGSGGSTDKILGEFNGNPDFTGNNTLSHTRGVISMARRGNPAYNSASSQFFIMHKDNPNLDGQYAAFGRVVEGMDVIDALANTPVTYNFSGEKSLPLTPPVIRTVEVIDYEKPE